MQADALFCLGTERELAPATFRPDGVPRQTDNVALFKALSQQLCQSGVPYMAGGNGFFFPYGRLYRESVGNHVEMAAGPAVSPGDAVKNIAKFTALLVHALEGLRHHSPGVSLLNNNRDYLTNATWGTHENYAIRVPPALLRDALLPFLVTRQVFAGSGTLHNGGFWLSPRAIFMELADGGRTTEKRAIYSTCRDEPLMSSGPFMARLHLIMGDGLMSQFGEWLKLGTTALVIRAAERNPRIGDEVRFPVPVQAIKALSRLKVGTQYLFDPKLISVQRHYLRVVADMIDDLSLPTWCEDVWHSWAEVLDVLELDPRALGDKLDPYIKLRLFERFLADRGRRWRDLVFSEDLYSDLLLLDVRYHALPDGVFESLDDQGVLHHRRFPLEETKPGCEAEPYVLSAPPREAFRSRAICEHAGDRRYVCDWTCIVNTETGARVNMSNPFASAYAWRDKTPANRPKNEEAPAQHGQALRALQGVGEDHGENLDFDISSFLRSAERMRRTGS